MLCAVALVVLIAHQYSTTVANYKRQLNAAEARADEVPDLEGIISDLEAKLEAMEEVLSQAGPLVIGWGNTDDARIYADVQTKVLEPFADDRRVALLCRAVDRSVDFLADPTKQLSNLFRIQGTTQRLELRISPKLGERLVQEGRFECAVTLVPEGGIDVGTKLQVLSGRFGKAINITKKPQ